MHVTMGITTVASRDPHSKVSSRDRANAGTRNTKMRLATHNQLSSFGHYVRRTAAFGRCAQIGGKSPQVKDD